MLAEFYAQDLGTANLELLSRFFEKYPEYTDKTFLSVKVKLRTKPVVEIYYSQVTQGAANLKTFSPDSSYVADFYITCAV